MDSSNDITRHGYPAPGGTSTAAPSAPCTYCGAYHATTCPRIESIEYHPNGTVKKVTLRAAIR